MGITKPTHQLLNQEGNQTMYILCTTWAKANNQHWMGVRPSPHVAFTGDEKHAVVRTQRKMWGCAQDIYIYIYIKWVLAVLQNTTGGLEPPGSSSRHTKFKWSPATSLIPAVPPPRCAVTHQRRLGGTITLTPSVSAHLLTKIRSAPPQTMHNHPCGSNH